MVSPFRAEVPVVKGEELLVMVDCDGPLADFVAATLDVVFEETGRRILPESITTWGIFDSINDKTLEDRVYEKIKSEGQCLALAVVSGAPEGIKRLQGIADLVVLTSPFHGAKTWVYERELWLERHFGIDPHDIIHARKKYHVYGDVLVDDRAQHLREWSRRWPNSRALLWNTPGNRSETGLERVKTWDEVYNIVDELRRNRAQRRTE